MRYEVQNDEVAVFFTKDEVNIALSYENAMHGARGVSSGELIYACLVDSINEKTGVPAIDWRTKQAKDNHPERLYPESLEGGEDALLVSTRDGQTVAVLSGP
jgi:hypothetical protein